MNPEFSKHLQNIEDSIKHFLPSLSEPSWQKKTFGVLPEAVKAEHIHSLIETTRSLVDLGGKVETAFACPLRPCKFKNRKEN